jgi:hypothetical protein
MVAQNLNYGCEDFSSLAASFRENFEPHAFLLSAVQFSSGGLKSLQRKLL